MLAAIQPCRPVIVAEGNGIEVYLDRLKLIQFEPHQLVKLLKAVRGL
jgi:hypothetical protein